MKKLSDKKKKHLKNHSQKQLRKKIKRKSKKYTGTAVSLVPIQSRFPAKPATVYFEDIRVPLNFNLKAENCDMFISFINKLKKLGQQKANINIIMDDTTEIGEGAIAMFLSVINELVESGVILKGTKPKPGIERDKLEKSGIFKYTGGLVEVKNRDSKSTILRTGGRTAGHVNLSEEIKKSNETVWGEKGRNPPLRGSVFEMMRNSCDHAFKNEHNIVWHFGISHDEQNKQVKFSFVDNGRGIIKSFTEGFLSRVINLFTDNADLLETAFKNGIESRTGLSWRGKGLPTIFENYEDGYFRNLVVISNDVYLDFDNKLQKKLSTQFAGTYYFWIMDEKCVKSCFT